MVISCSWRRGLLNALLALICASAPLRAYSGRDCQARPPDAHALQSAVAAAVRVQAAYEQRGPGVLLIARRGQDLSRHGLYWSHAAFLVKTRPDAPWQIVHLLNDCGTDRSDLFAQGLGDFFADELLSYDALIWEFSPPLSARLLQWLHAGRARLLHEPRYSLTAYPFAQYAQNSNQWPLEVVALAVAEAASERSPALPVDRADAQAALRALGYRPALLRIGTLERLGARVARANVSFSDQPLAERVAGRIRTTSVESLFAFVAAVDSGGSTRTFQPGAR